MNDEFGLTFLIEDFDNFSSSYRDNYSKVSDRTNDFTKELGNIEFLNKADAEMAVSILQDSYSDVRLKEPENEKYPFYFVYYSNTIEEKKKSDELSDFTPNFDLEATPLGNWSTFDAPVGEELEEDMEIKRYSDVVPKENRKYWYFTTHGVGPGSIPKGVNVIEIKDGKNNKGTSGTFVCLDAVLNTDELRKYDMKEMRPTDESLDEGVSTYSVVDLETGDKFGAYEDLSYAKTKAYQYMNMFGNKEMAIVDTDTNEPITKVSSKKSVSEDMFDMEDSYFSREQLDEFGETVQDELGTTSAQIYKVYWEPGNRLEVDWEYMGYEETTAIKVDMRGIRTIRDLERKYALKVVDDIHARCEEFERDSFSDLYDESLNEAPEGFDYDTLELSDNTEVKSSVENELEAIKQSLLDKVQKGLDGYKDRLYKMSDSVTSVYRRILNSAKSNTEKVDDEIRKKFAKAFYAYWSMNDDIEGFAIRCYPDYVSHISQEGPSIVFAIDITMWVPTFKGMFSGNKTTILRYSIDGGKEIKLYDSKGLDKALELLVKKKNNQSYIEQLKVNIAGMKINRVERIIEDVYKSLDKIVSEYGFKTPSNESLDETVEKHDTLNQKIFNGDELDPEVKDKLLEIVDRFKYNLEENDIKLDIKDVRIIGSNASYNYTDKSDIDLHIFADLSVYPDQEVLLQKVYDAYKALWNSKYDPVIRGHEVEIYVEPYTGD